MSSRREVECKRCDGRGNHNSKSGQSHCHHCGGDGYRSHKDECKRLVDEAWRLTKEHDAELAAIRAELATEREKREGSERRLHQLRTKVLVLEEQTDMDLFRRAEHAESQRDTATSLLRDIASECKIGPTYLAEIAKLTASAAQLENGGESDAR